MILTVFNSYLLPAIILAITGAVFGVLISLASIAFHVELDPRVDQVTNMLPGYNCGACGHPGCEGFANAVVFESADLKRCRPGKQDMRDKITAYLAEYEKSLVESN